MNSLSSGAIAHPAPAFSPDAPRPSTMARRPGRPSSYSPEKLAAICAVIFARGLSDTAAGALAGVKRSTLSRWKHQDEDIEIQLDLARAEFEAPRLEVINETRRKDGTLDWRAQAWLAKFAAPEVYGRPSRRRRLQNIRLPGHELLAAGTLCESVAFRPEIPTRSEARAPRDASTAAGGLKSVTFRPETPASTAQAADAEQKSVTFRPETLPGAAEVAPAAVAREDRALAVTTQCVTVRPEIRIIFQTGAVIPAAAAPQGAAFVPEPTPAPRSGQSLASASRQTRTSSTDAFMKRAASRFGSFGGATHAAPWLPPRRAWAPAHQRELEPIGADPFWS
jgi:hypothetical protein